MSFQLGEVARIKIQINRRFCVREPVYGWTATGWSEFHYGTCRRFGFATRGINDPPL